MDSCTKMGQPDVCSVCGCLTAPDDNGAWFCSNPFCNNYPRDGRHLYDEGWYRQHLIIRGDPDRED